MPRRSPQSAIGGLVPDNARHLNVGYGNQYINRAGHRSPRSHIRKRVLVTYVYLLMIRDINLRGGMPDGQAQCVPVTLQTHRGGGQNQAAHQNLGELAIGGVTIYLLRGLTQSERRVLAYCTSTVSNIHLNYNKVDNFIENFGRARYEVLANRILNGEIQSSRLIFDEVISIFSDAVRRAGPAIHSQRNNNNYVPDHLAMITIVREHLAYLKRMGNAFNRVKTIDQYITDIETTAF